MWQGCSWWLEFGRLEAIACLSKVTLYRLDADGAELGHIGLGEARPAGVVARFDGSQPCGFDQKACCCMEVVDMGSNAWVVTSIEGSGG